MYFPILVVVLLNLFTFAFGSPVAPLTELEARNNTASPLNGRNKDGVHCCKDNGRGWIPAQAIQVLNGLADLRAQDRIWVQGHGCYQAWSSGTASEIVVCNDNDDWINPDTKYIASYVEDILNTPDCHEIGGGHNVVCGQEFDTDHYNVIVKQPQR